MSFRDNIGRILAVLLIVVFAGFVFCLPKNLFGDTSYSTVLTDRSGELLGARIADDGQWRFPPSDSISARFATCCISFEDEMFYIHHGVNPLAAGRALVQNIRAGRTVSGGSTITMQLMRLSRHGKPRTLWEKAVESILALRLECSLSKREILALYAAHAPFGGNVVGLEAASWRYFGRPSSELSWSEAATLAILPNSPSLLHPGRGRDALKAKRDRLLGKLFDKGIIDAETFNLSCEEPLPDKPVPLPRTAPHLTEYYARTAHGQQIRSTVDIHLQRRLTECVDRWNNDFAMRGINDLAAVIIDVHSGEIIAYCGNADFGSGRTGCEVDAARAPRSTGSILKPFLYCALLQEGDILPYTLLPDIPININGFTPQNFDRKFYGAVPADKALARSLNVPSVHMLRQYGVPRFRELLIKAGMSTLTRPASDYGLSLILGGAEGTLYDITRIYAAMAAEMNHEDWVGKAFPLKDRTAIYYTLDALKEVNRPDEIDWHTIKSVRKVAWKTGTSYGFRDGWAVGVTPDYAVGVWAGNARGQGAPGLVGGQTAGPVMFDIFSLLPRTGWFPEPFYGEYINAEVCRQSGQLKGQYCNDCDTLMLPKAALRSAACQYHTAVLTTADGRHSCTPDTPDAVLRNMFILPPAMAWYYRVYHPEYTPLPPPLQTDKESGTISPMQFIYPEPGAAISLPKQLDSEEGSAVFTLAHNDTDATVFWHLDNEYIGETRYLHQFPLRPAPGSHTCTVVDNNGHTLSVSFTIQ